MNIQFLLCVKIKSHFWVTINFFGRSRRVGEKRVFSHSNESRLGNIEQDVTATSEICSWVADEKACSSDNQNYSVVKGGEPQRR